MDYPKSLSDVYLHDGKFTDGTADGTVSPSRDPAKWNNDVTDSILNVQAWTGEAPNEADLTQLKRAIDARIDTKIAGIDLPDPPDLTGYAVLGGPQVFTKAQRGQVVALADGATITPDFALGNYFAVTLGGNRTLAAPTNLVAGQAGCVFIVQDGTGGRTLSYAAAWDFRAGIVPSLSTTAGAVDRLDYVVRSGGSVHAALTKDVK